MTEITPDYYYLNDDTILHRIVDRLPAFLGPGFSKEELFTLADKMMKHPEYDKTLDIDINLHNYFSSLGLKKYLIPCYWQVRGEITIYAHTPELAYDHLDVFQDDVPLPEETVYLDASFELEDKDLFLENQTTEDHL